MFQIAAKTKTKKIAKNKLMMRLEMRFLLVSPPNLIKNLVTALPAMMRISMVVASNISVLIAAK
jgi:hypothetical protein